MLAHLLAVLILHEAQHQAVFKRRAVEDQRADGQQRVEPAARLVDGFGDEIRREVLLEDLLVLKGIVPLGERHGAGIIPAVDHFAGARHVAMALGALHAHAIDERLVQLDILGHIFAHFAQLGDGADGVHVPAILADPDGQRRAPIALAGEAPVDHILQEIAHAAVLDVVGHPVDGLVVGQQAVAQLGHADEPGGARVIDQRRVAAPAEGVIVRVGLLFHQKAAAFQIGDDHGIGLFHEHARPGGFPGHAALGVHQLHEGQVVFAAHARIVLAKGGRDVHDARAVRQRDIIASDHAPGGLFRLDKAIQRLILHAGQLAALHGGEDFHSLAHHAFQQRAGHDALAAILRAETAIFKIRAHAQGHVAGQRPGRSGPGIEIGVLLAPDPEAHEHGIFRNFLIALRHLVAGERGAAARAIGHDLVALIEQAAVEDLLERPPHGFNIAVVVGDVGVVHIGPEAHALAHALPFALVFPHALFALGDERLHAVLLNLLLAIQAEQLFHFQLHGKAVRIPTGLAQHFLAFHGLVAGDQVLHRAGQDVADMRLTVGRGRPIVKRKHIRSFALVDGAAENVALLPQLDHRLLAGQKIEIR